MAKLIIEIENGQMRASVDGTEVKLPWYFLLQADLSRVRRLQFTYDGKVVDEGIGPTLEALHSLDPHTKSVIVKERVDPVEPAAIERA